MIKKMIFNISIYIIILLIVFGISMAFIMNNLESSDEKFPYGAYEIGKERTIYFSFLNIPMKEEGITVQTDGSYNIRTSNYTTYTLAPALIAIILTSIIFYIIKLIRDRIKPGKTNKEDKFLFEWTFRD